MAMQLSGNYLFDNDSSVSDPFVVSRARALLQSHLEEKGVVRITYIALKQQLITEFGETEFGRNKGTIQKLLQCAILKENPKVAEAYIKGKARKQDYKIAPNTNAKHQVTKCKPEKSQIKSPRLYFYKMNEEESGSAEGNRYISNDDL